MLINVSQRKLVAEFFSNMAVVWFAAAFIAPSSAFLVAESVLSGILSLSIGIWLIKGVEQI